MSIELQTKKALEALNLDIKKDGNGYFQLSCPFARMPESSHKNGDAKPSFVIYPNRDLAMCYGCGLKFNLYDFFEKYSQYIEKKIDLEYIEFYVDFDEIEEEVKENPIINEDILNVFDKNSNKIDTYLESRGINRKNIDFDLYFDNNFKCVVCPIRLLDGSLIGATGRCVNKNSSIRHYHYFGVVTSRSLLGLEKYEASKAIICEGLTDFLNVNDKIKQCKLDYNVYSTLTCSLSDWQAMQIIDLCKPTYLAWDVDEAANSHKEQALKKLKSSIALFEASWDFRDSQGNFKDPGNFDYDEFERLFR